MLDGVSLDQLRTFVAAVDEGSFSAAARRLNRVQSAVSGWVSSLEAQIGVVLFDRSGRYPKLTPEGVLLLADARNIVSGVDTLKARAKLLSAGQEAELSVAVVASAAKTAVSPPVRRGCDAESDVMPSTRALRRNIPRSSRRTIMLFCIGAGTKKPPAIPIPSDAARVIGILCRAQ